MATDIAISPDAIAQQFADAIRNSPGVDQLWIRPYDDRLELWLIMHPIDDDAELQVAEQIASLIGEYPSAAIRPMLMHPADYTSGSDLVGQLPCGARQIALHN